MIRFIRSFFGLFLFRVADGDGAAADRGDNFTPTDDAADDATKTAADAAAAAQAASDAAAAALEAEAQAAKDAKAAKGSEGEGEDDKDKDGKPRNKDTRIPLSRHETLLNAERERRAAVETELAKYRQAETIAKTNADITKAEDELLKLESEYAKLLEDGDTAKAAAKMVEIRKKDRGIVEAKTTLQTEAATARAIESVRYDTAVERIEAAYPAINPDHPDFNKDKTAEVLELKEAFQVKGYTPTQALQKAVKYVLGEPKTAKEKEAVDTTPRVSVADQAEAARKAAAATKVAEATGKQPPSTAQVGLDHDKAGGGKIDGKAIMKMSYEAFSKLDEAALAEARGDTFVPA